MPTDYTFGSPSSVGGLILSPMAGGGKNTSGPVRDTSMTNPTSWGGITNTLGVPYYAGATDAQITQDQPTTPQRDTTYDRWGGLAGYQQAVSDWTNSKSSLLDSINNRINDEGSAYGRGVEQYYVDASRNQKAINDKAAQNELAKTQDRSDILGKVSRGIKSAGVMLGQKNASNSSAAQAIANAYGDIGNRDNMKVEQGYQINNEGINTQQQNFTEDNQRNIRYKEEDKQTAINKIANDAATELQKLNAQAQGASLPQRIAIEQEKNRIKSEASSKLSAYDAQLNQAKSLAGYDADQRRAEAQRLASLGTNAGNPFNIAPETDMQAQGQQTDFGLPIYTSPKKRI